MNNDLISRSELKKEIERIKQNLEKWVSLTQDDTTKAIVRISLYEEFIDLIDNAPTVEPEEVYMNGKDYNLYLEGYKQGKKDFERPQGKWIRYRDNPHQPEHIKCSNCGQYWSVADHDKTFGFCFKCGADMRGGKE